MDPVRQESADSDADSSRDAAAPRPRPRPPPPPRPPLHLSHPLNKVILKAYKFDGKGTFSKKRWDLVEGTGDEFCWYHIQIDPTYVQPAACAHILIDVLCPPLRLQDILSLVNEGPFCGFIDSALIFRINSAGPPNNDFTFRIAARVTQKALITVSLGNVPRLDYENYAASKHLLQIPRLQLNSSLEQGNNISSGLEDYFISTTQWTGNQLGNYQHKLADLFSDYRRMEADYTVPKTMASLIVHVIDAHVDLIHDRIASIEKMLYSMEIKWDDSRSNPEKEISDGIKCAEGQLKLQRILQVIAQVEQVLPRVEDKCHSNSWFTTHDKSALHEIIGRMKVLKKNVEILANRVTAIQTRLESSKAEQEKNQRDETRKRSDNFNKVVTTVTTIFLPMSILTGLFGMNVKGIPWVGGNYPYGFRNVMLLWVPFPLLVMLYFALRIIRMKLLQKNKDGESTKQREAQVLPMHS